MSKRPNNLQIDFKANSAQVIFLGFMGVMIIEFFFKGSLIFSESLFFDDAFMYERGIHKQSFNTLSEFFPIFITADFNQILGLKLYRWMINLSDDISSLRLIYLAFFGLACSLFSLILYNVTQDKIFSVSASIFSFITPFSPALILFTNGSYAIITFCLFFLAILMGTKISSDDASSNTTIKLFTIFFLFGLSNSLFTAGIFLSLAGIIWVFIDSKVYRARFSRNLFLIGSIGLFIHSMILIGNVSHPYQFIEGRLNYEMKSMFINGVSILKNAVISYVYPMVSTGGFTAQQNLLPAYIFIVIALSLSALLLFATFGQKNIIKPNMRAFCFVLFMGSAIVFSIGPYSVISRTHLWHYFPHMIFICSTAFLLVFFTLGKGFAYLLIAITAALSFRSYCIQLPNYKKSMQHQAHIAKLINLENQTWKNGDRVYLIMEGGHRASGLSNVFRSTGFNRYVSENPNAPHLYILGNNEKDLDKIRSNQIMGYKWIYKMSLTGNYKRLETNTDMLLDF